MLKPLIPKKAVVLLSGGLDSTILAYDLIDKGYDIYPIFFDYGQQNLEPTLGYAKYHAEKLGRVLEVSSIRQSYLQSSITGKEVVDEGITEENLYKKDVKKLSWVEGRNALMLINAMAYAIQKGADEVYVSFQADTPEWSHLRERLYDGAKDITPMFIDRINVLGELAFSEMVRVIAPFLNEKLDRSEIVALGTKLKVELDKTYSCRYYPECGKCEQCIIRKKSL